MDIEKISNAYTYIYEDQLEAAEEDYLEFFEGSFAEPASINWENETLESAKSLLRSLLDEIWDDRTDFFDLAAHAGLGEAELAEIGFVW